MKNKNGFTLIELLVVVLIIGILAAVALPQYTKAVERSRAAGAVLNVKAWADSMERYYLENGKYPTVTTTCGSVINEADFAELDVELPALKNFTRVACNNIYVMYKSSIGYAISKTMKNQTSTTWANRGLTCNSTGVASQNTAGAMVCKTLCGVSTLTQVWASGEIGCEIP